jgi:hypothetical protein
MGDRANPRFVVTSLQANQHQARALALPTTRR